MPLQTTEAADFYLDLMHSVAPGTVVEHVFLDGDPDLGGVELNATDCPGYTPYLITDWASFWLPASGGLKTSNPFQHADATDAWDTAAEFEGLKVDGVIWDAMPLTEAIAPDQAGPFQPVQITRRF